MMDTRFTAEFWVNKQGELVGTVRLPSQSTVTVEGLVEIISKLAEQRNMTFEEVLVDLSHVRTIVHG